MNLTPLSPYQTNLHKTSENKAKDFSYLPTEKKAPPPSVLLKEILELCQESICHELQKEKEIGLFSEGEEEGEKTPEEETVLLFTLPEPPSPFLYTNSTKTNGCNSASLNPISSETLEIFDKMCSEIRLMHTESCSKTILTLKSNQFINSPFYGAEITVEEFSTAPKLFNISIQASAVAIQAIEVQLSEFMGFLQKQQFSFGINRIDTGLLTESSSMKDDEERPSEKDKDKKRNS